jgi:hypothetical protein
MYYYPNAYPLIKTGKVLPYWGDRPFSDFTSVQMKKFLAYLKGRKNRYDKPLSAKTIRNHLIPLRVLVRDAAEEYGWQDFRDPFLRLTVPRVNRKRVHPFKFEEWKIVMEKMHPWYRLLF